MIELSYSDFFSENINQFLDLVEQIDCFKIKDGSLLDFKITRRFHKNKVSPIIQYAALTDAEKIVDIYNELYNGTYPYVEMFDVKKVSNLIKDPKYEWIVFKDPKNNFAGCITFVIDFIQKKGYIRGFMLKQEYQGILDTTKAMIGSMGVMCKKYKDKIYSWYVENRTVHTKSQHAMYVCGLNPVGFYPNKDIFDNKIESDLMQIFYDKKTLKDFRIKTQPRLIMENLNCYKYANRKYCLGSVKISNPNLNLDYKKIKKLKRKLQINSEVDRFGYEEITLNFKKSDAYFTFTHTPTVQNFEKTSYNVNCIEELYVFVSNFMNLLHRKDGRYCEVFVSAYKPEHQKVFHNFGLKPRGYIPSWVYNEKKNNYKDFILYSFYKGTLSKFKVINEALDLIAYLSL